MTDGAYAGYRPSPDQNNMAGTILWTGAPDHVWVDSAHPNQVRISGTFNPWTRDANNHAVDSTHLAVGGGFYIREVGIFARVGGGKELLWAVAKWPQDWVDSARPSDITLAYRVGAVYTLADDASATTIFAHEGAGLCSYDYVETYFLDKRTGGVVEGFLWCRQQLAVDGNINGLGSITATKAVYSPEVYADTKLCAGYQGVDSSDNLIYKFNVAQNGNMTTKGNISQVDFDGTNYHYHQIKQREQGSVPEGQNILGPTYILGGVNVTGTAECTFAPPMHFMSSLQADGVTTLGDKINQTGNAAGTNQLKSTKVTGTLEATGNITLGGTIRQPNATPREVYAAGQNGLGDTIIRKLTVGGYGDSQLSIGGALSVDGISSLHNIIDQTQATWTGGTNRNQLKGTKINGSFECAEGAKIAGTIEANGGIFVGDQQSIQLGEYGAFIEFGEHPNDPNQGPDGKSGSAGTLFFRRNGAVHELWFKFGAGNQDWTKLN